MNKSKKIIRVVCLVVMATMLLTCNAFAATGDATVNISSEELNLRESGSMESTVIDAAPRGAKVTVTSDDGSGWLQVSYNGKVGYMYSSYLSFVEGAATTTQTYTSVSTGSGNGSVHGSDVRFRTGPGVYSQEICSLANGTRIQINGACGSWFEVEYNGQVGYIYGDYVVKDGTTVTYTEQVAVVSEEAEVYTEPVSVEAVATSYNSELGQRIVDTAMQYIGVPYVWGGTSPDGFDCSGLVYYVYNEVGFQINRVAQDQYYNGVEVDTNDLQPGDILLFGSSIYNIWHVGIYVGNDTFIHAPYSGATVCTQSLSGSYGLRLVSARRLAV